jgi:hypothetical protein
MMMSAFSEAWAGVRTVSFSASARARERLPSGRPITTLIPLSRRFRAWACPWLPYPRIATVLPLMSSRFASLS